VLREIGNTGSKTTFFQGADGLEYRRDFRVAQTDFIQSFEGFDFRQKAVGLMGFCGIILSELRTGGIPCFFTTFDKILDDRLPCPVFASFIEDVVLGAGFHQFHQRGLIGNDGIFPLKFEVNFTPDVIRLQRDAPHHGGTAKADEVNHLTAMYFVSLQPIGEGGWNLGAGKFDRVFHRQPEDTAVLFATSKLPKWRRLGIGRSETRMDMEAIASRFRTDSQPVQVKEVHIYTGDGDYSGSASLCRSEEHFTL